MAAADDIVSYYKFDGDLTDSVGSNDGTNQGSSDVTGFINNGREFDGNNDYVDLGSPSDFGISGSQNRTVTLWFKQDDDAHTEPLFTFGTYATGKAWRFRAQAGQLRIEIQGSGYTSSGLSYTEGNWYFAAVVLDGTTLGDHTLYLGDTAGNLNSESASGTSTVNTDGSGSAIIAQVERLLSTQAFDGIIDEVAVFDVAKSQSDIETIYNGGSGLQYPFTTGTAAEDAVFFSHNF